ncbi:ribosomal protein L7/L12 [Brucella pituitosa]|uniref:ribosomal protein L7/L12 n=1 Tax=Brucella pituitosa TaxID=571256 RepID=UPI002005FCCA|nr:ribosomal protein L7/L12 [Brucella pituitosa]MCK4205290.1 ribosomal protein L7/L12 [Brucella pituitosa]
MGKLTVGDKVRSLVTQIDVRAGELYEVKTVDDGDVWVIDDVGDNWYLASDEFEILPVAAQTFKIGDRVRTEGWARFYEVVGVEDRHIWVKLYDGSSSKESTEGKTFEFETTPLKIEAGKYYRTRDGRKAGPMEVWPLGGWHSDRSERPLNGGVWLGDGTAKHVGAKDSPTLIAEWVDEPVTQAAPVAKPAIVALIENGQPKPSVAPFVHANETLAAKEAARLANLHKGKEFGVYVLTQKVSEPAPSYKHEWQRFAAKGEKLSAIKELRSVTGLGLKSAKDAVEHWIAHDEPYSRIAA